MSTQRKLYANCTPILTIDGVVITYDYSVVDEATGNAIARVDNMGTACLFAAAPLLYQALEKMHRVPGMLELLAQSPDGVKLLDASQRAMHLAGAADAL